jgi:hypothetical protein
MGMEHLVSLPPGAAVTWTAVRDLLTQTGFPVQLRMIDGELTFPDELPPEGWHELRVGTTHGMVTLNRRQNQIRVVTWGNADPLLRQAWDALTWAVAEVAGGHIDSQQGALTAAEFGRTADLPKLLGD